MVTKINEKTLFVLVYTSGTAPTAAMSSNIVSMKSFLFWIRLIRDCRKCRQIIVWLDLVSVSCGMNYIIYGIRQQQLSSSTIFLLLNRHNIPHNLGINFSGHFGHHSIDNRRGIRNQPVDHPE